MDFSHQLRAYRDDVAGTKLWDHPKAIIHQGAFSVVIMNPDITFESSIPSVAALSDVVKITHCPPSISLLEKLALTGSPKGLPRITCCLGPLALNQDCQLYWGFRIEKLYYPKTSLEENLLKNFLGEVDALDKLLASRGLSGWMRSAVMAEELSVINAYGLQDAFSFLASLICKEKAVLDLFREGNVLFDKSGQLCLSDPIALTWEREGQDEPLVWARDAQGNEVLPDSPFKLCLT